VTTRDALAEAEQRLAAAGVETPRVDAELLVAHVLGTTRTAVRSAPSETVDAEQVDRLLRRREAREPLAYVLGEWGFRRLTLSVDARALVPRPETEVLVERALALIADADRPSVLDVGTGCGAIALAIKDERPDARVTGVDTSRHALELARENVERLHLDVALERRDFDASADGWDVVVANPPYVHPDDWSALQPEIRLWEPREALVGVGNHEAIAAAAATRAIAFEVGDGQAALVADVLVGLGYDAVRITRDLAGRERVVEGRRA